MINGEIKKKLLEEISKFGNIYVACSKFGIARANYYRWKENDSKFKEKAEEAEMVGRENISDMAEYTVLKNSKSGDEKASEFILIHNSKHYKQEKNYDAMYKKS